MIRLISASGGESQSITPNDNTISRTLPLIIGMNIRRPWTSVVSLLARATSWPVGIRSSDAKSICWRCACISLRRSYWTSSATLPPR